MESIRRHLSLSLVLLASTFLAACAEEKGGGTTWTEPEKAEAENPDFLVQGEYAGGNGAVQVAALGKGQFAASVYKGGLPGAGWGRSPIVQQRGDAETMKKLTTGMVRTERKSPTLGAEAPAGAVVLFDGTGTEAWKNGKKSADGLLESGTETVRQFGDFTLHLEFRTPFKPDTNPTSQDRGNSGVYIFGRYEAQILDSFGLDYDAASWKEKPQSDPKQWCGCLYKFKLADTNMCLPPLAWQTYDIDFTAPRFEGGKKIADARITVKLNGVTIHDDVEITKGTGGGGSKWEVAKGPIQLQGHGNPARFRNIWVVEKS